MNTRYWDKTTLYWQVDALKKRLRSLYFFDNTGIDAKNLAYQCVNNLAIQEVLFDSTKICGILYKGDRKTSIALNARRTAEMQNFDCMHELIHYFLHDVCYCQCICSDEQGGRCIQQDRIQEWQANEGAAQFLVPYQDFIPRFSYLLDNLPDKGFGVEAYFARIYGVSQRVISNRIASLGYEIDQFRNGVSVSNIKLLSRHKQEIQGICPTNYNALCAFSSELDWDSVICID